MLRLKEIKRSENEISAKYFPESETELFGIVSVNLKSGEITSKIIVPKYESEILPTYCAHAAQHLKKIQNMDNLPTERLVMWY